MLDRRQLLIAGALAATSFALPQRAHAGTVFPLKATKGGRLMVAAQVNGHAVDAMFDSAAEGTFLDRAFAQKIGVAGAGSATVKGSGEKNFSTPLAKGVTLSALGITLRDQTVAIGDLSDVG